MGLPFWHSQAKLQQRQPRRKIMFWLSLTLLLLSFAGMTFLEAHLAIAPVAFLLYWTAVTALAIGLIVLAAYDMVRVPRELRQENSITGSKSKR